MTSRVRRTPKTRSSKKYCQEKFSCQGECTEAEFECEECGTLQCGACENQLHELAKFVFHDRRRLLPVSAKELCQWSCEERNFADVRCENCTLKLCHDCFDKLHAHGKRKSHRKTSLTDPNKSKNQTENLALAATGPASFGSGKSSLSSGEYYDPIKPLSPLGFANDDSLTYVSMPQDDATMMSAHSDRSDSSRPSIPDVAEVELERHFAELQADDRSMRADIDAAQTGHDIDEEIFKDCKSILLSDQYETLQVENEKAFMKNLGCDPDTQVKVVSIFGNTGDGKSFTLNHTFFGGRDIFQTCASQQSCTIGVWAAYDPVHKAIIIDTEGLLGITSNQNQRTRLLLKVLAISDVVIYRTRADRLHNDMFQFLGDASKAYLKHFWQELKAASRRIKMDQPLSTLGPAVIIFHETTHTEILGKDSPSTSAEEILRKRFQELELSIDAFSGLQYVGTKTPKPPTNFQGLLLAAKSQLRNIQVRSPRRPAVVYSALKVLNEKFSGNIEKSVPSTFPDQYFTCTEVCLSCKTRCTNTMNHNLDNVPHTAERRCMYQHQYDNRVFTCKACYDRGLDLMVVPKTSASVDSSWFGLAKYAWSGYVLECPNCGIIYRSRQFWYGNQEPEKSAVRTEVRHVWPGGNPVLQGTHNAARRLLDSISYAGDTIAGLSAKPASYVSRWVTDKINPPYWVPNAEITHCRSCNSAFDEKLTIHHCRACGQGFCDDCSSKKRPVPERGWGPDPVRVCDGCFSSGTSTESTGDPDPQQLVPRKVGEVIGSTFGAIASAIDYPLEMVREGARPAYWIPDSEIVGCSLCREEFGPKLSRHHCRACGQGVCDDCSPTRRSVPSRGWDHAVRVCKACDTKTGKL